MIESRKLIIEELKSKLFDTTRWPHYQLMFDHLDKVIDGIGKEEKSAILERCYIYGGFSIFSSLFSRKNIDIFDFIPPNSSVEERKNYQKNKLKSLLLTQEKIIRADHEINISNLKNTLNRNGPYNYIFIPNVLHHHPNPFELFRNCRDSLNKKGYLYIFDAILRENHQKPDDFIRFTPDGINFALEENGFKVNEIYTSKSPLEALLYTVDQVIQYDLPEELIHEIERLNNLLKGKFKSALNQNYENQIRQYTSFPVAYSVVAQRIDN